MGLIRYNADWRPTTFKHLVDRFLNDAYSEDRSLSFTPQVDIAETDKHFEIHFAIPGMKKDQFKIDFENNQLTVSGERKFEDEKKEKNFHSIESYFGSFKRSFYLPDHIVKEDIEANYKDGILTVIVPKDEKTVIKKTIEVK